MFEENTENSNNVGPIQENQENLSEKDDLNTDEANVSDQNLERVDPKQELAEQEKKQLDQEIQMVAQKAWQESLQKAAHSYPHIDDMLEFVQKIRERQLSAWSVLYPHLENPVVRQEKLQQEWLQLMVISAQSNRDPVDVLYQIAKRNGYVSPEAQETNLKRIADAQNASKTIAGSLGNGFNREVSIEKLASLSDEEFSKILEQDPSLFARLLKQ